MRERRENAEAGASDETVRPPSRGRRRLAAAVTLSLPFLLFLVVEAGLRLGGFGHTHPLFVPHRQAPQYLQTNPNVIRRFLADERSVPKLWIRPVPFARDKAPETLRVVVQGGSTAAGYPYGYGASPAGLLQQRLQRTFPERRVEVVTTAVSAVNSYTLLDFADEIVAVEPDAVVVYAGHNEYLGLLGVGSSFSAGRRRPLVLAFLASKDVRILQLGRRGLAALNAEPPPPEPDRRHLMARVVAEDRIALGSPLYHRGLAQYEANLSALLARYRRAGVPVFVGTLASNERGQPPFISGHAPGVDTAAWRRHFDAGLAALAAGRPAAARDAFDDALAVSDLHADTHFARGRALDALGRHAEARDAYLAAKDRDELRFRAPEEVNAILRRVAGEQGATVVEVQRALVAAAEDGAIGQDLMLEHLHPNVDGYFELADAYYEALHTAGIGGSWEHPVDRATARREMPLTAVDVLYGLHRARSLTAGWPFRDGGTEYRPPRPRNEVEELAQGLWRGRLPWPDAMRHLLDHHRAEGEVEAAAKVAALLADAFPHRAADQRTAAELLRRAGRPDAEVYRRRAVGR